tara:strand:- start:902 stop:1444 length:543 start_codon:yes stop_codon:yes gene_type:complete
MANDAMQFDVKPAERAMKGLFKKLGMLSSRQELQKVMHTCMVATQGMIADQFKAGGNIVDARRPLDYQTRAWKNKTSTLNNKRYNIYSSKPGEMTRITRKNFIARNSQAYPEAKATAEGFTLKLSSDTQRLGGEAKVRQRQYIGFFEAQLGIIPRTRALRKVWKFIINGNIQKKLKGEKI